MITTLTKTAPLIFIHMASQAGSEFGMLPPELLAESS